MSGQFAEYDTLEDRREILILFQRLGKHLPEALAMRKRARFLESLIPESVSCFAELPLKVTPCSAVEAYHLFIAIVGVLGVPIAEGAKRLDAEVRRQC